MTEGTLAVVREGAAADLDVAVGEVVSVVGEVASMVVA
jgi:hypothetical protein